jgi:hypothetical protein
VGRRILFILTIMAIDAVALPTNQTQQLILDARLIIFTTKGTIKGMATV